jgi:hypothetical protein
MYSKPLIVGGDTEDKITINVTVIIWRGEVMFLMRANLLQGPLEGVGPENRDFFGP